MSALQQASMLLPSMKKHNLSAPVKPRSNSVCSRAPDERFLQTLNVQLREKRNITVEAKYLQPKLYRVDQPSPGPGAYNATLIVPQSRAVMSRSGRQGIKSIVPGPGDYDLMPKKPNKQQFLYKLDRFKDTSDMQRKLTKQKQQGIKVNDILGPGSYDVLKDNTPKMNPIKINKTERFTEKQKEVEVGPGSHTPNFNYLYETDAFEFKQTGRFEWELD
ncbi:Conserved_hypothetical protein [Hexamita inflata]|uniref:Uncharacterized protein n=1 Tax=Hexamita inflata TaxID=28002 RepID=A0AA86NRV2_9EUKA|nr:Conserved hypothetical protein [Hexamita inflata]